MVMSLEGLGPVLLCAYVVGVAWKCVYCIVGCVFVLGLFTESLRSNGSTCHNSMKHLQAIQSEENAAAWRCFNYILKRHLLFMYMSKLSRTAGIPSRLASEPVRRYGFISKLHVAVASFIASLQTCQ
jgi:hypothetical protein